MLEYEKQKWDNIDTVGDFLDFLEDPKANILEWMSYNIDQSKSGFWIGANIDFNFDIEKLIKATPQIASKDTSAVTRVPQELEHHKKFNYSNGYDRHLIDDNLKSIVNALGFEEGYSAYINNQPPATLMHRHIDFMSCWTYEQDVDIRKLQYDKELKQPKSSKPLYRCFVALDDWHPGQVVNFEPDFWTKWKKGDVLFFDWRNTPHSTANCGTKDRPWLKITGTLKDASYVLDARDNNNIKTFKV